MDDEPGRAGEPQLGDALAPAARFLEADDRRAVAREPRAGLHPELHTGPAGNAVEHRRQLHRRRHGSEMVVEPGLRGLVVVRRDHQQSVNAEVGRSPGLVDPSRDPDSVANDLVGLLGRERRRLAGGADRNEPAHPSGELALQVALEGREIHFAPAHRRDQRSEDTGKPLAQRGTIRRNL